MTIFKPGKHYYTRSIGDHNCIFSAMILSRTAKTVSAYIDEGSKVQRFRVTVIGGQETIMPHGRYSMAPCIGAEGTGKPLQDWEQPGNDDPTGEYQAAAEAEGWTQCGDAIYHHEAGENYRTWKQLCQAEGIRPARNSEETPQGIPVINAPNTPSGCVVVESRLCEDCCNLYVHKEAEGFTDRDVCPDCFKAAMVKSYGSQGAAIKSMESVRL